MGWEKETMRRDEKHEDFATWCDLCYMFDGITCCVTKCQWLCQRKFWWYIHGIRRCMVFISFRVTKCQRLCRQKFRWYNYEISRGMYLCLEYYIKSVHGIIGYNKKVYVFVVQSSITCLVGTTQGVISDVTVSLLMVHLGSGERYTCMRYIACGETNMSMTISKMRWSFSIFNFPFSTLLNAMRNSRRGL